MRPAITFLNIQLSNSRIAHPINSDTRSRIQQIILDKYEAEIAAEEAAE